MRRRATVYSCRRCRVRLLCTLKTRIFELSADPFVVRSRKARSRAHCSGWQDPAGSDHRERYGKTFEIVGNPPDVSASAVDDVERPADCVERRNIAMQSIKTPLNGELRADRGDKRPGQTRLGGIRVSLNTLVDSSGS